MNSSIQIKLILKKYSKLLIAISCILISYPVTAQPTFWGDWESGSIIGDDNHNWDYLEAVAANRVTLIKDSRGTYARFEVRKGDNPLTDCCDDTDRAEVSGMHDAANHIQYENETSGTQRYSFSVKFDTTWSTITGSGNFATFLQLHGPNELDTNPAWKIFVAGDQIMFATRAGDITTNPVTEYHLTNGLLNKGHWIDFIITVKYKKDKSGFIVIQRRDEGQTSFSEVFNLQNIATLQYSSKFNNGAVGNHWMKHGLYRNRQDSTSILYLDGFTRENADTQSLSPGTAITSTTPTTVPTSVPTAKPTTAPTSVPTAKPTTAPTSVPTTNPATVTTSVPTTAPTAAPSTSIWSRKPGSLGSVTSSTDVYQVSCPSGSRSLFAFVSDEPPVSPPTINVAIQKNGISTGLSADPIDGDHLWSPPLRSRMNAGLYTVTVSKSASTSVCSNPADTSCNTAVGAENYIVRFACKDPNGAIVSSTFLQTQNQ